jgi:hypothetical protein
MRYDTFKVCVRESVCVHLCESERERERERESGTEKCVRDNEEIHV